MTRERYDLVLQPRWRAGRLRDPPTGAMRASIAYDSDNWSFWSLPFSEPGQASGLKGGTHLQLRVAFASEEFDAWMRLDSLWIETCAAFGPTGRGRGGASRRRAAGRGGSTQVPLGEAAELIYDIRGEFAGEGGRLDALRDSHRDAGCVYPG